MHIARSNQRDQSGLRPHGSSCRKNCCPVVAKTARNNPQVPVISLMPSHLAIRRETIKIICLNPGHLVLNWAVDQTYLRYHFKTPRILSSLGFQHACFGRPKGYCDVCSYGTTKRLTLVRVQSGRHINRKNRQSCSVDAIDHLHPIAIQGPVQPNTKQTVND